METSNNSQEKNRPYVNEQNTGWDQYQSATFDPSYNQVQSKNGYKPGTAPLMYFWYNYNGKVRMKIDGTSICPTLGGYSLKDTPNITIMESNASWNIGSISRWKLLSTLVPMRPIFEAYGMTVDWDNLTKKVTVTKDNTTIQLTHNSYDAYVNGEKVILNQAPSLEPSNNMFYVNLRFISETLGANVTWSKTTDNASIYINFSE